MELNSKLLACSRKLRSFRFNFEKLLANVQCNQVHIVTAAEFRVIDILEGHPKPISCMDVSQITKTIVSYSENLLLVHTLVKDSSAQQDQTIFSGEFKWKENWRCEVKMPIRNVSLSPIGDFMVLSGLQILTVWSRDSETLQSFSNIIYYSKEEAKGIMASVIKQMDLGDVMQSEISKDGRLIIFLENKDHTLKILYQDKIVEPIKEQKPVKKEENVYGKKYNDYNPSKKVAAPILEFNPYADIVPLTAEEMEMSKQQEMKFKIIDLSLYSLQNHKNPIEYFKMLNHDLLESEKKYLPNVLLTITSKNEVYMWQENLANSEMQFMCVHIFRGYGQSPYFDVSFVEFPPVNPKLFHEVQCKVSRIFDTANDKVLRLKKEENKLGIYQQNYHEKTLDWILILKDSMMEVYKVECLRNFPCRNVQIVNFNRIRMNSNPRDFHGVCKIYSSSCRDLNDVISIYCLNSSFQLIKFRKNFSNQQQDNLNGHASHLWKLDKLSVINQRNIRDILVHPQLPFVAYVMNSDEMYFFIEEENSLQIVRTNEMKFAGAYSIHHTSHHIHHNEVDANHFIKKAKWVKGLCQMMILYSNNTVGLLSSHSLLRILAHGKHPEEYLKIWSEKKVLMGERWDRLYEIQFQPDNGKTDEVIVDFEILDTQVNTEEGSFTITLVIFTDQYQQYVYQIETKFLQPGLKTMSSSVQLLSTQTDDCLLRVLSSFSGFWDEKRTSIVVMSEIDPATAPLPKPIEVIVEQPTKKKGKFEYSDDEDDDEGDIFSQFNKAPKQEKKKEVQLIQPPAPTKKELRIKLISFQVEQVGNLVDAKEEWKVEVPAEFKDQEVLCRMNRDLIGFLVKEGAAQDKTLYIYETTSSRYLGFINLSTLLKMPTKDMPLDYVFSTDKVKGAIIVFVNNNLYFISQSAKDGPSGKWSVIQVVKKVTGLEQVEVQSTKIYESHYQKLIFLINEKFIKIKSRFNVSKDLLVVQDHQKLSTNQIFANQQSNSHFPLTSALESFALFDPKLLRALYIKGYSKLVLKILVNLQQALLVSSSRAEQVNPDSTNSDQISDYLDFDIEQIYKEIEDHIKEENDQQSTKPQVKKQTASSMFDDYLMEGDSPKEGVKKEEKKGQSDDQKLETEFEENFDKFIKVLKQKNTEYLLCYSTEQVRDLNAFVQKFRGLYRKDFFAGTLADILLRDIFIETEEFQDLADDTAVIPQNVQPLNILQMMDNLRTQAKQSKGSISLLENWNSLKCCLAIISENQDVILKEVQDRFDFDTNFNWEVMKKLCIPLWLKDLTKLKVLTEKVAKGEYKAGDEFGKTSKAEKTALWYIMLGKKQQLCALYKIEPQYKKVHDLLINDFSDPKYKTIAEKNAMILMSKQNYLLAAAFFLLAKNLKSALQVALDRLKDPILAVLMCRNFEGDDSEQLKIIYQREFIERGEALSDPYLACLGHWCRKEYVKSINAFKIEGVGSGGGSNLQNLLKPGQSIYDIAFIKDLDVRKQVITIADAQANANIKSKIGDTSKDVKLPLASSFDYSSLDIIRAMKKLPAVKRELKSGGVIAVSGGADAFDFDDWGGSAKVDKAKEEEAKKKKEENQIQVDESKILQLVSYDASQSGLPIVALIVLSENEDFIENVEQSFKIRISKTIIGDLSHSFNQHIDFTQQVKKANNSLRVLADHFQIDQEIGKKFIIKQCDQMGLIGLEISFYLDMHMEDVSFRLEDYAIKLIDFVHSLTEFPFILDAPTSLSPTPAQSKKEKAKQTSKILPILSNLEQIVECLLGFSYQQPDSEIQSVNESIQRVAPRQSASRAQPMVVGLSHASGARTYITVNDPENESSKEDSPRSPEQVYPTPLDAITLLYRFDASQELLLSPEQEKALAKLNSKQVPTNKALSLPSNRIRTILVVYSTLIQICFATRKFQFVPSLLSVLRNVLAYQQKPVPSLESEKALNIDYQQLKIKIQKIKYSLQSVEEEDEAKDRDFMEVNEEKKNVPTEQDIKTQEFYVLWFRYIIAYNTCFVLKSSYQQSPIQNLINIRPSLVSSRKIQEVIISIINQRLQASELLKKFENMYRILENVASYYFEQFLSMKDRKAVVDSLIHAKDSDFKRSIPPYVSNMFETDKKFFKFAQFMDLKTFIQYLKEHELSLVYHTASRDSNNPYPVERSKDLFQTGIDLFRLKGEPVQQFTFDRCGRDIAAIAMLNKGIREIPVYKTLLCRNRMNNGLTLVDEELSNWHECLHRYDRYPIPNTNNDPIIAVIDKIYRQKTIHFIRMDKRKKSNTLMDYEVSPPDVWGGHKAQEYTKARSNLEILHEDYTYAIDAHPFLPLYMTGNAKGLLNLWEFEQENDRSLDQWVTELDQKNAIPKKVTIKKIAFSGYGDKVACSNMEGSFFIYNFEVTDQSKMVPIFNLKKSKDQKYSDFEYLNADTVVAMTSLKPKKLWLFDTLIPQRNGLVMESNTGGNLILSCRAKQQVYTFNERPGQVSILDMRTNKLLHTQQLHNEEITAVTMNEAQDSIVAGFKDGTIKIMSVAKGEFETRESQVMFSAMGNKKGAVTHLKLHPTNGALYASSGTGNFKLVRTKV